MVTAKAASTALRVVKQETAVALAQKLEHNVYAFSSRDHPNGDKLADGAIQRASVQPQGEALNYVKANPDGVGVFKRWELNQKTSGLAAMHQTPWDRTEMMTQRRMARIYMP